MNLTVETIERAFYVAPGSERLYSREFRAGFKYEAQYACDGERPKRPEIPLGARYDAFQYGCSEARGVIGQLKALAPLREAAAKTAPARVPLLTVGAAVSVGPAERA
jgi:hypothetical protein